MRRANGYGYGSQVADWTAAMQEVVVAVMIEKKSAVENLEEILAVPGLDMVQFGPVDYSISIGLPGQVQAAEVERAHRQMIEMAFARGIAPRVEINSFEQAEPYLKLGVRHFCIGWDTTIIAQWCRRQSEGMAALLKKGEMDD